MTNEEPKWGLREIPEEVYGLDRENLLRTLQRQHPGATIRVRDRRPTTAGNVQPAPPYPSESPRVQGPG